MYLVAWTQRNGNDLCSWHQDRRSNPEVGRSNPTARQMNPIADGKEVKDVFGRPGARVEVGSAR